MDRGNYGATAELIGRLTDPAQLTAMLRNPQYSGFTPVIIARLQEINHMRQAAQGAASAPPTIAQQALQQAQAPQAPQAPQAQQTMAKGGIVAFMHGGKVKRFADGGVTAAMRRYSPIVDPDFYTRVPSQYPEMEHRPVNKPTYSGLFTDPYQEELARGVALQTKLAAEARARAGAPEVQQGTTEPQTAPTEPAPVALPPLTSRDTGMSPSGLGIGALMSRSGGPRPDRRLEDYLTPMQKLMGENKDLAEARQEATAEKANALNTALMYGGLGMAQAAGERPQTGILGSLTSGATAGLTQYDKAAQARQQMLRDLGRQERAERLGLLQAAVGERGQDVRADRMDATQRMGLGLQAAQMKASYMQEQDIANLALSMANADRAKGIQRPFEEYKLAARQRFNAVSPAMQGAELRSEQQRKILEQKIYAAAENQKPGSGRYAVAQWQSTGVDPTGGSAQGGGNYYGSLE